MWHSDPMNSIGVPGMATLSAHARRHFARATSSPGRRACPPGNGAPRPSWSDHSRRSTVLVPDIVVGAQRVLHQVPGVVVAVPAEEALDLVQRVLAVKCPLAFEVGPRNPRRAEPALVDDPGIVGEVLGKEVLVREVLPEPRIISFK